MKNIQPLLVVDRKSTYYSTKIERPMVSFHLYDIQKRFEEDPIVTQDALTIATLITCVRGKNSPIGVPYLAREMRYSVSLIVKDYDYKPSLEVIIYFSVLISPYSDKYGDIIFDLEASAFIEEEVTNYLDISRDKIQTL